MDYTKRYGHEKVRVLTLEKNRGKGGAVRLVCALIFPLEDTVYVGVVVTCNSFKLLQYAYEVFDYVLSKLLQASNEAHSTNWKSTTRRESFFLAGNDECERKKLIDGGCRRGNAFFGHRESGATAGRYQHQWRNSFLLRLSFFSLRLSDKQSFFSQNGMAIAVGSRAHLEEESIAQRSVFRTFLMKGFHLIVWLLCVRSVRDSQCGFKLFTRPAALLIFSNLHVERWWVCSWQPFAFYQSSAFCSSYWMVYLKTLRLLKIACFNRVGVSTLAHVTFCKWVCLFLSHVIDNAVCRDYQQYWLNSQDFLKKV